MLFSGISIAKNVAACCILLTDKIRLTLKFFLAIAFGKPILSLKWLEDSIKAKKCLNNWDDYILKDPKTEKKFGFSLKESLDRAQKQKLFHGYPIRLTPRIEKPPLEDLKSTEQFLFFVVEYCCINLIFFSVMIRASYGRPIVNIHHLTKKAIIISSKEDIENAKRFAAKAPGDVPIHSTEFILLAILKQEINFDIYKLKI